MRVPFVWKPVEHTGRPIIPTSKWTERESTDPFRLGAENEAPSLLVAIHVLTRKELSPSTQGLDARTRSREIAVQGNIPSRKVISVVDTVAGGDLGNLLIGR